MFPQSMGCLSWPYALYACLKQHGGFELPPQVPYISRTARARQWFNCFRWATKENFTMK